MNSEEPTIIDPALPQTPSALPFEPDRYLKHVEDFQMTEAQKVEFLRALWDIMSTFVRLGFGVESVLPTIFQRALESTADGVEETIPTHEFNVAADAQGENNEKGESS